MQTLYRWLVYSSANEEKWSLAIKGMLGLAVTWAAFAVGVLHWSVPAGDLNSFADSISLAVSTTLALIPALMAAWSAWATVYGWARKIVLTFQGQHAALQ